MLKKYILIFIHILFFSSNILGQNYWKKNNDNSLSQKRKDILYRKNTPTSYVIMNLELSLFQKDVAQRSSTNAIIELPNSNGELEKFKVKKSSYLAPKLANKYPEIQSYSAQGITDPTATAKISFGNNGMHAIILSGKANTLYIDPLTKNKQQYIVYQRNAINEKHKNFECLLKENASKTTTNYKNTNDGKLRKYRLAIVATGEYSQYHLNQQNIPTSASETEKKATVLSAINTTITRVNAVFERDLAVNMTLVSTNDKIIYLDAATDELSNSNSNLLIDESQVKCDTEIGTSNYDIGHAFSTGAGGLAQLRSVCAPSSKAKGVTGRSHPINDPFDIDYVSHEIGHQFGATHTQNNDCNRTAATAVEPGSGSTIMGYAGICSPNIQNNSNDHFHAVSIAQMQNHISGSGSCASTETINNTTPTVSAGNDYSIPKNTPFALKATATDANGEDSLTYNWEQIDNEIATMPPLASNTAGPTFRSLPSKTNPIRYFPALEIVTNSQSPNPPNLATWEVLPNTARELNFAVTVRDNNSNGGATARDDVKINTTNSEAFIVNTPSSNVSWQTGDVHEITWHKGNTNEAPINCKKVNIRLSTDGGKTFPIYIKKSTPNDGSENIQIPNIATTKARIMVEAADNVFYNVNSSNFSISNTNPTFLLNNSTVKQTACNTNSSSASYTLSLEFINGFNENTKLSASGLPIGATAIFTPSSVKKSQTVTMEINNLNGVTKQEYQINIKATASSKTQNTDVFLHIKDANFPSLTLTNPVNKSNNESLTPTFTWNSSEDTEEYSIEIATDIAFENTIETATINSNSYTITKTLTAETKYYWRVKSKNECGESDYSSSYEFTTAKPNYCNATYTDQAGGTEHITKVVFNTINNSSGDDTVDGYEDFTAISTAVNKNENYNIGITFNTQGFQDHCYVFIDWNQDFKFNNTTERYDLGTKSGNNTTASYSIQIPNNATLGTTRMRVIIEYDDPSNGFGQGACNEDQKTEWGEVEDYSLIIKDVATPSFELTNVTGNLSVCNKATNETEFLIAYTTSNGFNDTINLSIAGVPENATANLSQNTINKNTEVKLTLGNLKEVNPNNYNIEIIGESPNEIKKTRILLNINNGICTSNGTISSTNSITNVTFGTIDNTTTNNTGYSNFTNLKTNITKGEAYLLKVSTTNNNASAKTLAWIDWNQNCVFEESEAYNLSENIRVPNTEDTLLGATTLRIATKNSGELNPCSLNFNGEVEDYTVIVEENLATNENLFSDLQLGPIPLANHTKINISFRVKNKALVSVKIIDLKGQLLNMQNFNNTSSIFKEAIEIPNLQQGIYLIQIENDGKSITKKIVVN